MNLPSWTSDGRSNSAGTPSTTSFFTSTPTGAGRLPAAAEAERCHDLGREEQASEEIEVLTQHLAAAMGLRGRDRPAGSAAERARSTVRQRSSSGLQRIAVLHPSLADHLAARVRTGTFCAYQPDPERPVVWDLGPSGHR
jgi:hypothetical protein